MAFILTVLFLFGAAWLLGRMDFSIDENYETGERLLWYTNPFDKTKKRKYIVIGKHNS